MHLFHCECQIKWFGVILLDPEQTVVEGWLQSFKIFDVGWPGEIP